MSCAWAPTRMGGAAAMGGCGRAMPSMTARCSCSRSSIQNRQPISLPTSALKRSAVLLRPARLAATPTLRLLGKSQVCMLRRSLVAAAGRARQAAGAQKVRPAKRRELARKPQPLATSALTLVSSAARTGVCRAAQYLGGGGGGGRRRRGHPAAAGPGRLGCGAARARR